MREVEIKMPSPSGFHCSPSGDTEYEEARRKAIHDGIPTGYELVGNIQDVKTEHRTIVEHFAIVKVREKDWKGIPRSERKLWFGTAEEGMEAPWMGPFGACFVKIWDIRRREDGVIEYGIGNRTRPTDEQMGWITADGFYSEWPD